MNLLKYDRAKLFVLNRIAQLQLKKGDLLPSLQELSDDAEFSLISLRRALDELEADGVIEKHRGRRARLTIDLEPSQIVGHAIFVQIYHFSPVIPDEILRMKEYLRRCGVVLHIHTVHESDCNISLAADCEGGLGIFVSGWISRKWVDLLKIYRLPLFVIGSNPFPEELPGADIDYLPGIEKIQQKIRTRNCQCVAVAPGGKEYLSSQRVANAFKHNSEFQTKFCWYNSYEAESVEAFHRFLTEQEFDALVVRLSRNDLPSLMAIMDSGVTSRVKVLAFLVEDFDFLLKLQNIDLVGSNQSLYHYGAVCFLDRIASADRSIKTDWLPSDIMFQQDERTRP